MSCDIYHFLNDILDDVWVEYVQAFYPALAYLCYVTALDYPPFFAYLEKLLSIPASLIDPKIVDLNNLNYDGWSVIVYQRTTVILTELVLGVVLLKYVHYMLPFGAS